MNPSGPTLNGNRIVTSGGYTFGYDNDGNLTSRSAPGLTQTLSWNSLGQLTSATTNGVTVTFRYDGLGRRVVTSKPQGVVQLLWDGDDMLMELDAGGAPIRSYTYLPGVDRPHSVRIGSNTYYYAVESPSNVIGLMDAAGKVVNYYQYDPFGVARVVEEQVYQPLRFAGREWIEEVGLYYFRNRWYDPGLRRFISEDPIGLAGGINPYTYANNNPLNFVDPMGLAGCPDGYYQVGPRECAKSPTLPGVTGTAPSGGGGGRENLPTRFATAGALAQWGTLSTGFGMMRVGDSRRLQETGAQIAKFFQSDLGQCTIDGSFFVLSLVGEIPVVRGGQLVYKAGRAYAKGRATRYAYGKGSGRVERAARRAIAGAPNMAMDGVTQVSEGWAIGLSDSILSSDWDDPAWAFLPLGGTAWAGVEAWESCSPLMD